MGIFFNTKQRKAIEVGKARDLLLEKLAAGILGIQSSWASFMQKQSERLSRTGKITVLSIFCLACGGYCAYLIRSGLTDSVQSVKAILPIENTIRVEPDISHDENDLQVVRVLQFKYILDSLAHSPAGRRYYQQLMRRRPGLMDSLKAFEALHGKGLATGPHE